jgi:TP901 family phage tail tape measure protein
MADLEKTVKILFLGEDQISKTITDIGSKVDVFSATIESIANPLAGVADGVIKTDAALAAMAIGGLAYAFTKSKDFESAVIELQKVLGDGESADAAIKSAKDLSNTYGQSATDILGATAGFRQAGYTIQDALTLTKDSLDLVIAGNIDAAESSGLIISALKGFGLEADQARRYIDILNAVSNNYATDVNELAKGMSGLSPIANQFGLSMEETAGILTPVIEVFRSGDEAAVALKTGLLKLVDDAKPVRDALASIGVSQYDANGQLRSGKDILLDVAKAFTTLDDNQKLFVTQQLVGIEQSARMVQVFDGLSKTSGITATAMEAAGSAAKEVAKRLESSQIAVDRFKVGWENLSVAIGDQFREAVKEVYNGGTEIERVLESMVDNGTFKPVFDAINKFANEIGDLLKAVAKNLPEAFEKVKFDDLLKSFGGLEEAVKGLFEGVDLTTTKGLAEAIQKAVDTIRSLVNVTSGMIEGFKPFFDAIKGGISSFNELDSGSQKTAGNLLALSKAVAEAGLKMVAAVLAISASADELEPTFRLVINSVGLLLDGMQLAWNGLKLVILDSIESMLSSAATVAKILPFGELEEKIDVARRAIGLWRDDVSQDIKDAAESGKGHLNSLGWNFELAGESSEKSKESIKSAMEKAGESMATAQTKAESLFKSIPAEKITSITAKADESGIKKAVESAWNYIEIEMPDGSVKRIDIAAKANKDSAKKAKEDIDREIPAVKQLEIQTELDIEKLKAVTDVLNTSIEWSAKIDIAQIEADAEVAKAAFESIGEAVAAVADASASMFGDLSGYDGAHFYELYDILSQQVDIEEKLVNAQVALIEARTAAYKNGTAQTFTLQGDNLSQGARTFMYDVLKEIQLDISERGDSLLLGTAGVS